MFGSVGEPQSQAHSEVGRLKLELSDKATALDQFLGQEVRGYKACGATTQAKGDTGHDVRTNDSARLNSNGIIGSGAQTR
jgi:hypothetical protein